MAEGAEETENNSNNSNADTPAMLGTVLPCEAAITASLGGMKREFDATTLSGFIGGLTSHLTAPSSPPSQLLPIQTSSSATIARMATASSSSSSSSSCSSSSSSSTSSTSLVTAATTAAISSLTGVTTTKSPTRSGSISPSSTGDIQQQPLNMKSEDFDKDESQLKICSSNHSAEITNCTIEKDQTEEFYKSLTSTSCDVRGSSPHEHAKAAAVAAAAAAAQAHLNGTMQDMINLQKLQNLASLQQTQAQQQSSQSQQQQQQQASPSSIVPPVAAALASLQGLAGLTSAVALNSPLNLSVGSTSTLSSSTTTANNINNNKPHHHGPIGSLTSSGGNNLAGCSPAGATQMPQLILASGQLVQGVQGAQLLIPTSQGIAVQTILTIPVSQQINTNEQVFQSFAALNTGAAAVAAAAAFNPPPPPMAPSSHQLMKPNLFSTGVQQLLAALHPELFAAASATHSPAQEHLQCKPIQLQQMSNHLHSHSHSHHNLPHAHHQTDALLASPKVEHTATSHQRDSSPPHSSARHHLSSNSPCPPLTTQHPKQSPSRLSRGLAQAEKISTAATPPATSNCYSSPSGSQMFRSHSPAAMHHNMTSSSATSTSNSQHSLQTTPSASTVLSSINRLTSTNGELTITKSHGPTNHAMSTASSTSTSPALMHQPLQQQQASSHSHSQSHHLHHPHHSMHHSPQQSSMKMSPSIAMQQMSPSGTDNSTADLLVDSPNEPTINQATSNVVDGIDLDEIKEFAKAFKLRRLSLGLTQTQVGQALSVTEGPAYSQSAICSALAAQMYAAQLSSQQQNMFEKLDITPKSAQKIKPVLERWMKEAEESHWNRYKTGQNHLTDFIGVEPSKKRKRRTSFTPQALELLNAHFERNTHPSGTEITGLAHQLGYEREVIRIWFCNKRQALKNTVRMMSKGMV